MCHDCGMDLRDSPLSTVQSYFPEIREWLLALAGDGVHARDHEDWSVMRHLARLLMSETPSLRLHEHLCLQVCAPLVPLPKGRLALESCELDLRHHLMQLIGYLMMDLPVRMEDAWRSRALRYNHMLKDFKNAPAGYERLVAHFENWRDRL